MHHALLVLRTVEAQVLCLAVFREALTEAGHVAVVEDAPEALDDAVFVVVARDVLRCDETDQRLADREVESFVHGRER